MAKDLAELKNYRIERVQLFDMFPHTAHYEVLTLLTRNRGIAAYASNLPAPRKPDVNRTLHASGATAG